MARKMKNIENVKHTMLDLDYGEKTERGGKWDKTTVGPGIWRETLKNVENEKCTL